MPLASTALVTGANRGLGLEWVRQLADEVDRLYVTCRRPDEATDLAALAERRPDAITLAELDVTDPAAIQALAERVQDERGAVDLLVNNAGISGGGTEDRFGTVEADTMTKTLQVNAVGPHLMTQTFAELLRTGAVQEGRAAVVNVTSQLGSIQRTSGGGWNSYRASKAALNMCTRLQAAALKDDDVIAVALHPGWVRTDMGGPNARLSTTESVAGMIDVVNGLTRNEAGAFLTYEGEQLPW